MPWLRTLPMTILLAFKVLLPAPRLSVLGLVGEFCVELLVRPGVRLLSPTVIVPATMVLLVASVAAPVAPAPWPRANSFPPVLGTAPVPVVKLKSLKPLMSKAYVIVLVLVLLLPMPTKKLELLDPPFTISAPPPLTVSFVVIGAPA